MAKWFEEKLGAEVIRTMQQGKPRIDLKLGGASIFIAPVADGDGTNGAPTIPYRGLDHFGLSVNGIDEIAADLKKKGVEFTREPTTVRPGTRVCFIKAPDGVSYRTRGERREIHADQGRSRRRRAAHGSLSEDQSAGPRAGAAPR